jgi:hypothetical protein
MGVEGLSDRTELRSSRQFARVDGVWYGSAHFFRDGHYPPDITIGLYSSATGEKFRVPADTIEEMLDVAAKARYRGVWFELGSFWSRPEGFHGPDWDQGRIRGSVAPAASDCYAWLVYRGKDGRVVSQWPGARPVPDWPQNYDEVTIPVAVTELEGYSEDVAEITPRETR